LFFLQISGNVGVCCCMFLRAIPRSPWFDRLLCCLWDHGWNTVFC